MKRYCYHCALKIGVTKKQWRDAELTDTSLQHSEPYESTYRRLCSGCGQSFLWHRLREFSINELLLEIAKAVESEEA